MQIYRKKYINQSAHNTTKKNSILLSLEVVCKFKNMYVPVYEEIHIICCKSNFRMKTKKKILFLRFYLKS